MFGTVHYRVQVFELRVLHEPPKRVGNRMIRNALQDFPRIDLLLLERLWIEIRSEAVVHDVRADVGAGVETLQAGQ